ncbi:hypothetical protein CC78DRAFT_537291 [Lojkania enalia]|uniref:Uncharacterized protein n=1 Tax=Lojkania enalia TaxID=147567 RepID=A0A9P4N599_9PLEO|nr:hypothetical protein CC78DRAFT_537291 [Didymosphaeria enalia]
MAAAQALAIPHLVSDVLYYLSEQKYKERRQNGRDQPVQLMEYRPNLIPCILVNRLWADKGTSIIWKNYPHLAALRFMDPSREQYYANKVQKVFLMNPTNPCSEALDSFDHLAWPNLRSLELDVDFHRHGARFRSMLQPRLEHLELSGNQSGGQKYFINVTLPALFNACPDLRSVRFGTTFIFETVHASALIPHFDSLLNLKIVEIKWAKFQGSDSVFTHLSQRPGLEAIEIELDPGLNLLPFLEKPYDKISLFPSLKRLLIVCYAEVALSLLPHLHALEELHIVISRMIPETIEHDELVLEDLIARLPSCTNLRSLKAGIDSSRPNFPGEMTFLPRLSGETLVRLALKCPKIEEVGFWGTDAIAIDGSNTTAEQFDAFCASVPLLKVLDLKYIGFTVTALEQTALQSLGRHCPNIETIRLKFPCKLPSLPVSSTVPQIIIDSTYTPTKYHDEKQHHDEGSETPRTSDVDSLKDVEIAPLFPHLKHLAISRPQTVLALPHRNDSDDDNSLVIVDPELEEDIVRTWARPMLTHFPNLEILEAWGDWTSYHDESLNYFLPMRELLASTWEFLSGIEQDLWSDDEETEASDEPEGIEGAGIRNEFQSGSSTDWDTASYLESLLTVTLTQAWEDDVEEADSSNVFEHRAHIPTNNCEQGSKQADLLKQATVETTPVKHQATSIISPMSSLPPPQQLLQGNPVSHVGEEHDTVPLNPTHSQNEHIEET